MDLLRFTNKIPDGKLHFCSVKASPEEWLKDTTKRRNRL